MSRLTLAPPGSFEFRDPYVLRYWRRCRRCGDRVEVLCAGGATCPRDPYYVCSNCHAIPGAFPHRLADALNAETYPQPAIAPPSDSDGKLDPETQRADLERPTPDTSNLGGWSGNGEPIEAGGQPQAGGRR